MAETSLWIFESLVVGDVLAFLVRHGSMRKEPDKLLYSLNNLIVYFFFHFLHDKVRELQMIFFSFSFSGSKAANNCIFAFKTFIPDLPFECVAFDEFEEDRVDGKGGRGTDQTMDLVVLEKKRNQLFGDIAVSTDYDDAFAFLHFT